jgi:hypothetical protein
MLRVMLQARADHRAVVVGRCLTAGACGVALTAAFTLSVAAARAAEPWRVVMLPGTDPTLPAVVQHDTAFRRALIEASPSGVAFYTDPLDGMRFQGEDLMPEFLALLGKKYRQQPVDLVVGVADFALQFTERHHQQLWPGRPVLITGLDEQRVRERGMPAAFASIHLRIDVDGTIAIAEALQPNARRMVVVAGSAAFDAYWAQRVVQVARQRSARAWSVDVWSGLPLAELRSRLAALDRDTAVVYTAISRDRDGRTYMPWEPLKAMVDASALVRQLSRAGPHRRLDRAARGKRAPRGQVGRLDPARRGRGRRCQPAAGGVTLYRPCRAHRGARARGRCAAVRLRAHAPAAVAVARPPQRGARGRCRAGAAGVDHCQPAAAAPPPTHRGRRGGASTGRAEPCRPCRHGGRAERVDRA